MKNLTILGLAFILCTIAGARSADAATLYVSPQGNDSNAGTESAPFQTFARAQSAVRALRGSMSADTVVYFRSGVYPITSTLQMNASDGGANGFNVIYSSYPGETARISGGKQITGWTQVSSGLYKASTGGSRAREFWVNGTRAIHARSPNTLPSTSGFPVTGNSSLTVSSGDLGNAGPTLPGNVQVVLSMNFWEDIIGIQSVSGNTLQLNNDATNWGYSDVYTLVGNSPELADAPGEWYITGSEIYYRPRSGEDMSSAYAVFPVVQELMHIDGATNLQFKGLRFEHTVWTYPESGGKMNKAFSSQYDDGSDWADFPAAIAINNASNLLFEGNVFRHTASGAIIASNMRNSAIVGNAFTDIGAYGIYLKYSGNDTINISNNYFYHIAAEYHANHAIDVFSGNNVTVEHNELENMGQGGISFTQMSGAGAGNVSISYNRVHDGANIMSDYGGVYVWGVWPSAHITENYIYGFHSPHGDAPGIYCDEGYSPSYCGGWRIDNNVLEDNDVDLYLHVAQGNTIVNFDQSPSHSLWDSNNANSYITSGTLDVAGVKSNSGVQQAYAGARTLAFEESGGSPTSPSPSPSPSPTPPPQGTVCDYIDSTYTLPTNFGSPYTFFTNPAQRIIDVYCNQVSSSLEATLFITKPASIQYQYTYMTAYQWNPYAIAWEPQTLTCHGTVVSNLWCNGYAETLLPNSYPYVIAYICTYVNNSWKCGCRDGLCANSYWQLQRF